MDTAQDEFKKRLLERFNELPKQIQVAITSADINKRLRELATAHKLHVDEWDSLENEVMLTLLGFERPEQLEQNIQREMKMSADDARALAKSINTIVFEPIRSELERQLEHPDAMPLIETGAEAARTQILGAEPAPVSAPQTPSPTPPVEKPTAPVVRMPASGAYKPGEASTERQSIVDDPYREPRK